MRRSNKPFTSVSEQHRRDLNTNPFHQKWREAGVLLTVVPDISRELPVASDLLPHHEIFAGDLLRRRTFGLEAQGPDLPHRGGPKWFDVESCDSRIADLLGHAFPHCLDRGS